jgi:hypothetical protein
MDVYAQMETRFKRSHGESSDRLVREARELVKNLPGQDVEGEGKPIPAKRR